MNLIESRMVPQGKTHDCFHGASPFLDDYDDLFMVLS
jgi:hypothetical protein